MDGLHLIGPMRHLMLLLLASVLLVGPVATAHGGDHQLTISAKEDGCPAGQTFCFEITAGSVTDLSAGDQVSITLRNDGQGLHNLYVTTMDERDASHRDTAATGTLAKSDDLDGGERSEISFTVPASGSGLYFWCDVSGHEQLGMWMEVPTSSGSGRGGAGDEQNGSPGPAGILLIGLLALGALTMRRRT